MGTTQQNLCGSWTARERVQGLSQLTPLITKVLFAEALMVTLQALRRDVERERAFGRAFGVKGLVPGILPLIAPDDCPNYGQMQGKFVCGMSNQES